MCRIEEKVYLNAAGDVKPYEDIYFCERSARGNPCSNTSRHRIGLHAQKKTAISEDVDASLPSGVPSATESGSNSKIPIKYPHTNPVEPHRPPIDPRQLSVQIGGEQANPEIVIHLGSNRRTERPSISIKPRKPLQSIPEAADIYSGHRRLYDVRTDPHGSYRPRPHSYYDKYAERHAMSSSSNSASDVTSYSTLSDGTSHHTFSDYGYESPPSPGPADTSDCITVDIPYDSLLDSPISSGIANQPTARLHDRERSLPTIRFESDTHNLHFIQPPLPYRPRSSLDSLIQHPKSVDNDIIQQVYEDWVGLKPKNDFAFGTFAEESESWSKLTAVKKPRHNKSSRPTSSTLDTSQVERHILGKSSGDLSVDWEIIRDKVPDFWKWDIKYQTTHSEDDAIYGCWTCTPLESDDPKLYPLTIASAPVVLPVEHQWPPAAGLNPPPDPRPSTPIDCRKELPLEVIRDLFLTFEGSVGFYVLISGLIQVIVPDDFDLEWAASHLPHKYGSLRVCYIRQTMEPTMWPSSTEITDPVSSSPSHIPSGSEIYSIQGPPSSSSAYRTPSLEINDFIEARPRNSSRSEKFSGRIGLKVFRDNQCYLVMSTHIITEAILARSYRDTILGRAHTRFRRLGGDWNEHVNIWASSTKIGNIHRSFDTEAEIYPHGFRHDITLIKPDNPIAVRDIVSPVNGMGWLNHRSWTSLRQKTSAVKILGPDESHRTTKSVRCSRPSEVLVVGEGIFRNQIETAGSKPLKDYDISTWKDLVSRALLYRVHPDFDPPNGYSGIALYADGVRHDGSEGPGIVGFQSFVQRSGHVQNFDMDGTALERRLQLGRIAFYGAFEVPEELKRDYTVA